MIKVILYFNLQNYIHKLQYLFIKKLSLYFKKHYL